MRNVHTTRAFTRDITEKCLCAPFALRNFSDTTQVICKKIQYLKMVILNFFLRKLVLQKEIIAQQMLKLTQLNAKFPVEAFMLM